MPGATSTAALSPENQLCLVAGRADFTPSHQDRASMLLREPLRWNLVMEQAAQQDVVPLIYRNLRTIGFPGVPDTVLAELETLFRMNALRNHVFARELARVLKTLGSSGIPVIPVKGLALAESLYGDISQRACSDLDILVPRAMVVPALQRLLAAGYEADFVEPFFRRFILPNDFQYALVRADRGTNYLLEVHWDVLGESWQDRRAEKDLWEEARPSVIFGVPAYGLSPEWEFLFLAAHLARNWWWGLKWMADIHALCLRGGVNWERVGEKASRLGWEQLVQRTLVACHALLDTPLPPLLFPQAVPVQRPVLRSNPDPLGSVKHALFCASLLKRPTDQLRYLLRRVFIPSAGDLLFVRLPASLYFAYSLIRPVRLTLRVMRWLLLAVFRRDKRELAQRRDVSAVST